MDYKAHIEALAAEYGVEIHNDEHLIEEAWSMNSVTPPEVHIPQWGRGRSHDPVWSKVTDEDIYWVALHEMGHTQGDRLTTNMLHYYGLDEQAVDSEAKAWLWGLDHAEIPLNEAAEKVIDRSMSGYVAALGTGGPATAELAKKVGATLA